jgi:(p)ppGpp synthase/HD superfamily hydrolase
LNIIEKAIIFAAKAHNGQMRKSSEIPYITHPFAVGMLLQKANCSENVIAAGLLHDTLEDTSTTVEDLREHFGDHVTALVQAASEPDKTLSWEERKQHTIQSLKEASVEEIQVITADKLHNLQSIRDQLQLTGEDTWNRFKRGGEHQHWYYSGIVRELLPRKKQFILIAELERVVEEVFGPVI